jgi:hypothetical protein
MISVRVTSVHIPAMSTIGFGDGYVLTGECGHLWRVSFVGDHRMMRDLGEALSTVQPGEDPPVAIVPEYAITYHQHIEEGFA